MHEKGIAYDMIIASPHSAEVSAIHPMGKVPVLRHGDTRLGESRAIIDYIDVTFDGSPLVPLEPAARFRSDMWTSLIITSVEPVVVRQLVMAYMFPKTTDGTPDRALIGEMIPKVAAVLDVLEVALVAGELGADGFGRTDAYLVPILVYAAKTPEGGALISKRPRLSSYLAAGMERPSVKATIPDDPGG